MGYRVDEEHILQILGQATEAHALTHARRAGARTLPVEYPLSRAAPKALAKHRQMPRLRTYPGMTLRRWHEKNYNGIKLRIKDASAAAGRRGQLWRYRFGRVHRVRADGAENAGASVEGGACRTVSPLARWNGGWALLSVQHMAAAGSAVGISVDEHAWRGAVLPSPMPSVARCRTSVGARQAANGLAPAAVAEVASQAKDDSMTDEG